MRLLLIFCLTASLSSLHGTLLGNWLRDSHSTLWLWNVCVFTPFGNIFISAVSPLSFKMSMSVLLKEEHWSSCTMGDAEMTSQPPSGLGRTNWHWYLLGLGPCYPGLRFQHEVLHRRTKKVKNGPPAHQATMFLTEHEWCSWQINRTDARPLDTYKKRWTAAPSWLPTKLLALL